jgi:Fanconi anemia group D2 protein
MLDANATSITLRASLNGLLQEMHRNGTDVDNLMSIESMQEIIMNENEASNDVLLLKMLLPLTTTEEQKEDDKNMTASQLSQNPYVKQYHSNDASLIKVMLRVDAIQPALLSSLLQKLQEIASSDETISNAEELDAFTISEDIRRLIISHIRWLELIVDPSSLVESIVECIGTLPSCISDQDDTNTSTATTNNAHPSDTAAKSILLDLMATLPDIIDDSCVAQNPNLIQEIISTLREVRNAHSSLLIPCLDTISSIRFTSESQVKMVIEDALEALETVTESWLLPSICKFLMQNTPRGDAELNGKVIDTLRRLKLGLEDDNEQVAQKNDRSRHQVHGNTDSEALMLEYIAQGLNYRSDLTTVLMTAIKGTIPSQQTAADIWLLFCCGTCAHYKAKVNQIFKSKAQSGGFTADLIMDAIHGNGAALQHLFQSSMMPLADTLLRSNEDYSRTSGCSLYEEMFLEFIDRAQRQEIVGQLVIHISSGSFEEIDGAFKVFCGIISRKDGGPESLRIFRPFLTSLLDNIQNFDPVHLRSLFLILFSVQGERNDGNSSGGDEVLNCIRKNLAYQQNIKHMHIAIIGAVSFAAAMGASKDSEVVSDVLDTLIMVHKSCSSSVSTISSLYASGATSMSLFLDELGLAVQSRALSPRIRVWILESFSPTLEDNFLGDLKTDDITTADVLSQIDGQYVKSDLDRHIIEGTSTLASAPKGAIRFNIDKDDAIVYMKLLTLHASNNPHTRDILSQQLCPLLRLLSIAYDERFGGEGINNIDAVLGCPLLLPDLPSCTLEFTHLTEDQKITTTSCLFTAVSWCRELVNSFVFVAAFGSEFKSSQLSFDQDETRSKVVKRLRCLLELEEELILCARKCYSFTPPGIVPAKLSLDVVKTLNHEDSELDELNDLDDSLRMTVEERKAFNEIKKAAKQKSVAKAKSKQKALRLQAKYEDKLENNVRSALRPLTPLACLALGFPELVETEVHSAANGKVQFHVGDNVSNSLLKLLIESFSETLTSMGAKNSTSIFVNNSYEICCKRENSPVKDPLFEFLDTLIDGSVFVSLHRRIVAISSILGEDPASVGADDEKNVRECASLIFQSITNLLQSVKLASSESGKAYLAGILRQVACGDLVSSKSFNGKQSSNIVAPTKVLFDLIEEVFDAFEDNGIDFSMVYVNCIDALVRQVHLTIDQDAKSGAKKTVLGKLRSKVAERCLQLLRKEWSPGTTFNKNNVGVLLNLYLEYSDDALAKDANQVGAQNPKIGRLGAINILTNDALLVLPKTDSCKGPVRKFSTCCQSTFGSFFSAVLASIADETKRLLQSVTYLQQNPEAALDDLGALILHMNQMFQLTKENEILAKSMYLLMQLRNGTKFVDIIVKKGVLFFSSIFVHYQNDIVRIVKDLQKVTRQMMYIVQHGKISKDANIVREGPKVRKVCETFIHKVKNILKKSGVEDAFILGELKLKAIDGSVIDEKRINENEDSDDSNKSDTESEMDDNED